MTEALSPQADDIPPGCEAEVALLEALTKLQAASRAYHGTAAHIDPWDTCSKPGCRSDRLFIEKTREA